MTNRYVSVSEASKELKAHGISVTVQTLYVRLKRGTIPYKLFGKTKKIKLVDLFEIYLPDIVLSQDNIAPSSNTEKVHEKVYKLEDIEQELLMAVHDKKYDMSRMRVLLAIWQHITPKAEHGKERNIQPPLVYIEDVPKGLLPFA